MIQSSSTLLGRRSLLIAGTARCRTVRSITYTRQASVRTATPSHSRRPARRTLGSGSEEVVIGTAILPVEGFQGVSLALDLPAVLPAERFPFVEHDAPVNERPRPASSPIDEVDADRERVPDRKDLR